MVLSWGSLIFLLLFEKVPNITNSYCPRFNPVNGGWYTGYLELSSWAPLFNRQFLLAHFLTKLLHGSIWPYWALGFSLIRAFIFAREPYRFSGPIFRQGLNMGLCF